MEKTIQISAGRGPLECAWVVAQVLKLFIEDLKKNYIDYTILHKHNGLENGSVESVTLLLKGQELDLFLTQWIGTIQWVGKSQYRKYHKRKNWFIGLFEVQSIPATKVNLNNISYQTMRSQGKGGQHVNKVNTAVRATHNPTGIAVVAMDSRSQLQNKKLATERLLVKLEEARYKLMAANAHENWTNHLQIERGNPVKVFKGKDFKKQPDKKTYKSTRSGLKSDLKNELKQY